jgi:hypothetical protein
MSIIYSHAKHFYSLIVSDLDRIDMGVSGIEDVAFLMADFCVYGKVPDSSCSCPFPFTRAGANNKCYGLEERSVVWITPVKDADIYVDYNNTGIVAEYKKFSSVKQFTSMKLVDKGDSDMSGAVIFATQPGSGTSGTPVDIAAAWGQNPDVSLKVRHFWSQSLLINLKLTKSVSNSHTKRCPPRCDLSSKMLHWIW